MQSWARDQVDRQLLLLRLLLLLLLQPQQLQLLQAGDSQPRKETVLASCCLLLQRIEAGGAPGCVSLGLASGRDRGGPY